MNLHKEVFYVKNTGNDKYGDGTESNPFRTVIHCIKLYKKQKPRLINKCHKGIQSKCFISRLNCFNNKKCDIYCLTDIELDSGIYENIEFQYR